MVSGKGKWRIVKANGLWESDVCIWKEVSEREGVMFVVCGGEGRCRYTVDVEDATYVHTKSYK